MELEFMLSEKGRNLLVKDDYKFYKQREIKNAYKWHCVSRNCLAKLYTDKNTTTILRSFLTHNHEPDKNWRRQAVSNYVKKKGLEKSDERPQKLIEEELIPKYIDGLEKKDVEYIKRNLNRARQSKKRAKVDHAQEQVDLVQEDVDHAQELVDLVQQKIDFRQEQVDLVQQDVDAREEQVDFVQEDVDFRQEQVNLVQQESHLTQQEIDHRLLIDLTEEEERSYLDMIDKDSSDGMVRNYKRKTNRGMNFNWSEDNLYAAIHDIKSSILSTHRAALKYGIPEATLRRYLKKDEWTNISGPCSSGSKLSSADPNRPSTSTQEEVFPDTGIYPGLSEAGLQNTNPVYDPSIVIKQEIIETEVDPSSVFDVSTFCPSENLLTESSVPNALESLLEGTVTPNSPESLGAHTGTYIESLNASENIVLPTSKSHTEVRAPITPVGLKVLDSSSAVPVRSSKRYKKSVIKKVLPKRNSKRSPNPSGGSSDEDEGRRRRKDKFDTYGEFIASKLRDLDPRSCAFVQTAIADLIFEAELGRFLSEGDKSIFAAKTRELLKNMPPPCESEA